MGWRKKKQTPEEFKANLAKGQQIAKDNRKKDRIAAQREKREQKRRNQGK